MRLVFSTNLCHINTMKQNQDGYAKQMGWFPIGVVRQPNWGGFANAIEVVP